METDMDMITFKQWIIDLMHELMNPYTLKHGGDEESLKKTFYTRLILPVFKNFKNKDERPYVWEAIEEAFCEWMPNDKEEVNHLDSIIRDMIYAREHNKLYQLCSRVNGKSSDWWWFDWQPAFWYTLFWHFFVAALDDDIYEAAISDVVDFAVALRFTEADVTDICTAVNTVLAGDEFEDGEYITDFGKEFFGHEGA